MAEEAPVVILGAHYSWSLHSSVRATLEGLLRCVLLVFLGVK